MNKASLKIYREEVSTELTSDILDFWMKHVIDFSSGGFNGSVTGNGVADPKADKGVILATRILWTFARACRKLGDARYLKTADLMYHYIQEHFVDKEHGGVFWILDHQGKPVDPLKKFYGQAFAIYAFAEYSRASGNKKALDEAKTLFELVEKHGRDKVKGGYIDAVGRDWAAVADTRLSEKDLNTPKTMNTNLHVMEAFSGLIQNNPVRDATVIEALESLAKVFLEKIILPNRHFGLFFDMNWNEVSGKISFGHDIEGSWLLSEAAQTSGNESLIKAVSPVAAEMARVTMREGLEADGGVLYEREADGSLHPGKEWWMQTEAMVGFLNAYEITGEEIFAEKSILAWDYCKKRYLREGGEWFSNLDSDGLPDLSRVLAGPWKCPYHTGRACMEIMERIHS